MNLFYTPDIESDIYALNEAESKHCTRVLRLGQGDHIHLTDGKGSMFEAEIIIAQPKKCIVKILNKELSPRRDFQLHLAVAPTKNIDRFEWFLEKATEIGIDEITPLLCTHSERRNLRIDRLEKVILSAIKQSLKSWFPRLNELKDFKELVKTDFDGQKFIAHLEKDNPLMLKDACQKGKSALILIGPEGDFSEEEISLALSHGFSIVSLGPERLRTETAAIVACHTINLLNQ